MQKVDFYTKNIAFSAMIGCIIGMVYVAMLSSNWSENAVRYGTYGITVLVGFFASAIAIGSALLSINKQQELIDRRHISARAVLPLTLSRLYKLAEDGFETVLNTNALRNVSREDAITQLQRLEIPTDNIKQIRECVEAADKETQEWLSLILAHWQLETSRLESTLLTENLSYDARDLANSGVDWLVIRAMIIHLFEYSRTGSAPEAALALNDIAAPLRSGHRHNEELSNARTRKLQHIEANGGATFEGFRSRLAG
jgi:hypothetical protein